MNHVLSFIIRLKQYSLWAWLFSVNFKKKKEKEDWYIARVACMGQDVLQILNLNTSCYNIQKGRVDYLNKIFEENNNNIFVKELASSIRRIDIISLVFQQKYFSFSSSKSPIAFILDSYSELTDQKFISKNKGYEFYLNYSDLDNSKINMFECLGLLEVSELTDHYRQLFTQFNNRFKNKPIVFLHFSAKLDTREKFKIRELKIKEAISQLSLEFGNLYQFHAPEHLIKQKENDDDFPYHYSNELYQYLANEIIESNILN